MNAEKLELTLRSSPAYNVNVQVPSGRLTKESHLLKAIPNGPSRSSPTYNIQGPSGRLKKENGFLRAIPNGSYSLSNKPVTASSLSTTKNWSQEKSQYLSQAQLIESKARARKVSPERLLVAYNEKQMTAKTHYPKENKDWQRWFVEASVWGHLCGFFSEVLFKCADSG
jgi:hypothetical protein